MKRGSRWRDFVTECESAPNEDDEGPLAEALSMADCIGDELDEVREHLNLADSVLADLRALLDSGELREPPSGSG